MLKKIRYKKFITVLLILAIIITLTACGQSVSDEEGLSQGNGEENTEIKIVDHLGREVLLEKPAESILSGYYITTSMLIALGLEDHVTGIEAKADSRPIYHLAAPHFLELPNVGTLKEFDLEGAAALNPDLIILSVRLKDAIESLEKLGIKVLAVNPESTEELIESIEMIGKATGSEERARDLVDYIHDKNLEVKELVEGQKRKTVYLGGNSSLLSTATGKMYQHSLIENAGGENVAGDIDDTYWAEISYEQLVAYDPDIIIGVPGAAYGKEDILKDGNLHGIKAVKNEEIYFMPDSFEFWDSPVPSGILGTMWLTSVLHEDLYPFEDFKQDAYDFYNEFYDIEIDKELITK